VRGWSNEPAISLRARQTPTTREFVLSTCCARTSMAQTAAARHLPRRRNFRSSLNRPSSRSPEFALTDDEPERGELYRLQSHCQPGLSTYPSACRQSSELQDLCIRDSQRGHAGWRVAAAPRRTQIERSFCASCSTRSEPSNLVFVHASVTVFVPTSVKAVMLCDLRGCSRSRWQRTRRMLGQMNAFRQALEQGRRWQIG